MIRTIIIIGCLLAAVLWLPLWAQIALFAIAIFIGPHRFFFVIPAIVSDALYAPTMHVSLVTHWLTLLVLAMLGLHWIIMRTLRVRTVYGLEA